MATYPAEPTPTQDTPTQDTTIEKDPTEPCLPLLGTTSTGVQPGEHNGGSEKRPWIDWIVLFTAVVAAAVLGGVVVWLTERGKCERGSEIQATGPLGLMAGSETGFPEVAYTYPTLLLTGPAIQIFCVGISNRHLYRLSSNNLSDELGSHTFSKPPEFHDMGGLISSTTPHVTALSTDGGHLFVIGTDQALYHKFYNNSGWQPSVTGYEKLDGAPLLSSASVVSWTKGAWGAYLIGGDGALYQIYLENGTMTGWKDLGSASVYAGDPSPTATSWGEGRLDIFLIDRRRRLRTMYWDNKNGSSWKTEDLSGDCTSRTAAVSSRDRRIDVVVRGGNGALWHIYNDDGKWSAWGSVSGDTKIQAEPELITRGRDRIDAFAWGSANQSLLHYSYDGKTARWSKVEDLGGGLSGPPKAASHQAGFSVFAYGSKGQIIWKTWNENTKQWFPEKGFEELGLPN